MFTRCSRVGFRDRSDTRRTLSWFNDIVLLASLQYHAEKQEQVRQLLERLTFPIQVTTYGSEHDEIPEDVQNRYCVKPYPVGFQTNLD
jgi:hypothetical protein